MKSTKAGFYMVKDIVSNLYKGIIIAINDMEAVRKALIGYAGQYPIRDLELWNYGVFDDELGKVIENDEKTLVSWSIYKLPEDKAEASEVFEEKK